METAEQQTNYSLANSEQTMTPVDGCGCGQSPAMLRGPAASTAAIPAADQSAALVGEQSGAAQDVPAAAVSRRAIKLVITLQPEADAGYRAVLAVGADGCDPLLRATAVADLPAALDEVPGLIADAEARWQVQPRYPAAAPTARRAASGPAMPKPREGKATTTAAPAPASRGGGTGPEAPATIAPATRAGMRPVSPDQLSLFG